MSELMTPEDCRYYANGLRQHGCPERAAEWERAAATIETLQAQLDELAPASADTNELRRYAGEMRDQRPARYNNALSTCAIRVANALDASRAWVDTIQQFNERQFMRLVAARDDALEKGRKAMVDLADKERECERLRAELAKKPAINCKPDDLPGSPCYEKLRAECERLRELLRRYAVLTATDGAVQCFICGAIVTPYGGKELQHKSDCPCGAGQ